MLAGKMNGFTDDQIIELEKERSKLGEAAL
jgi:hypothetical protein